MSECLKRETLLVFVDRELSTGEMESAERHIALCAACRRQLDEVRAMSVKVDALLSSLAPNDAPNLEPIAVISIPPKTANARMRWTAMACVGVLVAALLLFAIIRRSHTTPAPNVARTERPVTVPSPEKKDAPAENIGKVASVAVHKPHPRVREFQALDDGEPIQTGMIYRVSLPALSLPNASASQSAKRVSAEVIVDEFGKVRAIRFLQ